MTAPRQETRPATLWLAHLGAVCALALGCYLVFSQATSAAPDAVGVEAGLANELTTTVEVHSARETALADDGSSAVNEAASAVEQDPEPLAYRAGAAAEPAPGMVPAAASPLLLEPAPTVGDGYRWPAAGLRPRDIVTLPILMYHHVRDLPSTVKDPYLRDLTVPATAFRQQLDYLAANDVQTLSLDDLMANLQSGQPLPPRSVVLTFDDGYDDNYRYAYPLMLGRGMKGTFFIITSLVGQPGYMTWDQLHEMQLNGMSIESHTLDHLDLALQSSTDLNWQLAESRRVLELNLLRPVRFLAYPSGRYNERVVAAMRSTGYEAAVTTRYGLRQSRSTPYELVRVRVKGADTVASLAAKLVPPSWAYLGRFGR